MNVDAKFEILLNELIEAAVELGEAREAFDQYLSSTSRRITANEALVDKARKKLRFRAYQLKLGVP